MRLESVLTPNPMHHRVAHTNYLGKASGAPVGGRFRRALRGQLHDLRFLGPVGGPWERMAMDAEIYRAGAGTGVSMVISSRGKGLAIT